MASTTFADLLAQAESAGISGWTPNNQNYDLAVSGANGGKTQKGDPKIGVQFKVQGGPDDGKTFWTNFNLIAFKSDGQPNAQGLAITFRDLAALGAGADVVATWDADSPSFTEQISSVLVGNLVNADVQVRESNNGYTNINLRKIKRRDAGSAAPAPAAAAAAPAPASGNPW